jgi:hypothetical protein
MNERIRPRPTIDELQKILDSEENPDIEIMPDGTVRALSAKPDTIRKVDGSAPAIFVRFSAQVGPNSQMELSFGIPLDMTPRDLNAYVDKVASVTDRQHKKGLLAQARLELDNNKKQLLNNTQNRANYEAKQATEWAVRGKRGNWDPSGQERAQIATFQTNDKALREDRIPLLEKQIVELEAEIKDA